MKKTWKYVFPLILGWCVYFCFVVINDSYQRHWNWNRWSRKWWINGAEIALSVGLSYVCTFIALWWERKNKKRPLDFNYKHIFKEFFQVYLTCVLLINIIGGPLIALVDGYSLENFVLFNIIPVLVTLLLYAIIRGNFYIQESIKQQLKLEKLNSERLESELKFLKNQIHPHFLFNALNTIYFQMDENVKDAKNSIEKFADLLRYRLYDEGTSKTAISKEMEYLNNYIQFQKIRNTNKLKLDIDLFENDQEYYIYPFLMLPLVENAFKFVGGDKWIYIRSVIQNQKLFFKVSNSKEPDETLYRNKNGIGLSNLKRRLELLYPSVHELNVENLKNEYTIELKIPLYDH